MMGDTLYRNGGHKDLWKGAWLTTTTKREEPKKMIDGVRGLVVLCFVSVLVGLDSHCPKIVVGYMTVMGSKLIGSQ